MTTPNFGFTEIPRGGSLADEQWKYSTTDRRLMDLLFKILFRHHHDGVQNAAVTLTDPLQLEVDQAAGSLPAGQRIFYKYTLVDENGIETLPSPEAFIDTPPPVASPSAPQWEFLSTGGTLLPGQYTYVLSAYKSSQSLETRADSFTSVSITVGTNTNKITLTLPTLPAGADGFNVYRRKPGAVVYAFLASIDMTGLTPPTTFVDDGSITEDANNVAPTVNTTNAQNEVYVSLPGATPSVPAGFIGWKLYRSFISGVYTSTLVHYIVEQTSEGSGIILPSWTDLGTAPIAESPPTAAFPIGNPDPVMLTDGAEVQGTLAPANSVFKHSVEWRKAGTLSAVTTGTEVWRCPWEKAIIMFVQITLGKTSTASGNDVIVDVNKWDSSLATPSWGTIFTTQANRPRVVIGDNESDEAYPDIVTLVKGDKLTYDIDQIGGAATPTDSDLLVQVVMWHMDSTATSVDFGT